MTDVVGDDTGHNDNGGDIIGKAMMKAAMLMTAMMTVFSFCNPARVPAWGRCGECQGL
jgi:hypothetical protein